MTFDVAFAYLILFGAHWLLLRRFVLRDLPPVGKGLLIALYSLHGLLIALFYASRGWGDFWSWYLDYRFGEYNPSASYAAALYVLIAFGAWSITFRGYSLRLSHRLYWLGVGAFFGFLGLDEYFALHEGVKNWSLYYGAVAGLMAVAGVVLLRRDQRAWVMLVGGLAVAGIGGVGLETLVLNDCIGYLGETCGRLPLIEEALENVGLLTALLGVILYASQHMRPAVWTSASKLLVAGGLGSVLLFAVGPWVVPDLEARFMVEPLTLEYQDGGLSVLAYRVSQTALGPGDQLDVLIYWRVNRPIRRLDGLSAHLVNRSSGQSFARVNRVVEEPRFQQAAPGNVYRTRLQLKLPPDIPTPASYWLTLTVWGQQSQEFVMQPVSRTDRELLSLDTAVLRALPVVDQAATLTVDHPMRYNFQGDLSLTGYSAHLDQKHLALQFSWENRAVIRQPLVQFLHIFGPDGSYIYSVDRPPLADDFPTIDWPVGLHARSDWQFDLPDTLLPGEYSLRTGLYESATLNRWQVWDSEGAPLQDGIIELGAIRIEP